MDDLRKVFSKNLIKARKARKLTQERMAEKIGISVRSYQGLEYQESWPSHETLALVALALDMPAHYLISEEFGLYDTVFRDVEALYKKVKLAKGK